MLLWVKALHVIFIASWFAALFYLPRILVNLADVARDSHAERERLLLMARRLHRFGSALMAMALALGLVLWLHYQRGSGEPWLYAKLVVVALAIGYHYACRALLRRFEIGTNRRSGRWLRVFNEAAVLLFALIVVLVVVKPWSGAA